MTEQNLVNGLTLLGLEVHPEHPIVINFAGRKYSRNNYRILAEGNIILMRDIYNLLLIRTHDGLWLELALACNRLGMMINILSYREALFTYQQLPIKLVPPAEAFPDDFAPA